MLVYMEEPMRRGPLYRDEYRPRLSGHETFPLRYGWLKKAFDAVAEAGGDAASAKAVFHADDAIARFGVGKNMVASIRHWAAITGVIDERSAPSGPKPGRLGIMLFGRDGVDPFFEHPATAWMIHWQLAGVPEKTTWFWAFSYYPSTTFDREQLVRGLAVLANDRGWKRAAQTTLKSDVACFVRTYVSVFPSGKTSLEDTLESPLTELGLIRHVGKRDGFRFVRGVKPSLGDGVFAYAVTDFWSRFSNAGTLSFESLAHESGSPGRVFLLNENDLADRLSRLEEASGGVYRWSETAGLKQLIRTRKLGSQEALTFARADYAS